MSIIPNVPGLDAIIQDSTLRRTYHDSLWRRQLYRMEALKENWVANQGDTLIETRGSLLPVVSQPLVAGQDPVPVNEAFEQWAVTACQYSSSVDTQMPASWAALASKFARDAHTLGLNAGQSLNRLVRNKLYTAYTAGTTHADNSATGTSVEVGSINGFTQVVDGDGQLQTVSVANPKSITVGTDVVDCVGAAPIDANFPLGAGILTLAASITFVAGEVVTAVDRSAQFYSGGGTSTDSLTGTDILTLEDIRNAVSSLQDNSVPPHEDGMYHAHIVPAAVSQVFGDPEFQSLNESNYGDAPYRDFIIGKLIGTYHYRDEENPGVTNSGALQANRPLDAPLSRLGAEISSNVTNKAGVNVLRTIITGGGAIYEKQINESEYLTDAGVTGKVGGFNVQTNGVQVDVDGVRFTIRSPLDRLQQIVSQTWSFSGDWGIPSDVNGGKSAGRYKRAVIINSGTP